MTKDATACYFDEHSPHYSKKRFKFALQKLHTLATPDSSLVDVGCGVGNVLSHVREQVALGRLVGIDVSKTCLSRTREALECETYQGSILDDELVGRLAFSFDFVLLGAVLHHLVGRTRSESARLAVAGLQNSLHLLKPGGHLFVIEPTFEPPWAMTMIFELKKFISKMTTKRVQLGGHWNNIGPPVVSYYSNEQLKTMIEATGCATITAHEVCQIELSRPWRLVGIRKRADTTLVAQKD